MPEKSLTDLPRGVREQFEKGVAALDRSNLDYAIELLLGVVKAEPGFLGGREALRRAAHRKAGEKTGLLKKLVSSAGSSPALARAKFLVESQPLEAMFLAEQVLAKTSLLPHANPGVVTREELARLREEQMKRMLGQAGATGAPQSTGSAQRDAGPSASYAGRIVNASSVAPCGNLTSPCLASRTRRKSHSPSGTPSTSAPPNATSAECNCP